MTGKFSFLKPDFKSVIPEIWKDIFKSTVLAGLGALGLLLIKQVPVVGTALQKLYAILLYAWILIFVVGLLIGFWVASAILRTKLRALDQLAETDALTGLGNLRKQNVSLKKAIHAASPEEHLSIIYIDIDNFKSVNDAAGHDSTHPGARQEVPLHVCRPLRPRRSTRRARRGHWLLRGTYDS